MRQQIDYAHMGSIAHVIGVAPPLETVYIAVDAVAQTQPPLLDELHDGHRRGRDLGKRSQIEDRIFAHGYRIGHRPPIAVGTQQGNTAVPYDTYHGPGRPPLINGASDSLVDPSEAHRIEADTLGRNPLDTHGRSIRRLRPYRIAVIASRPQRR